MRPGHASTFVFTIRFCVILSQGEMIAWQQSLVILPTLSNSPNRGLLWGLFTLSAATLTFEINLTRLFSVTQFYHFAFLIVSVALLGFGASGTFLAIFPDFGKQRPAKTLVWIAIAAGGSMLGAYLVTNWLPFNSFQIVWNPKQVAILIVHLLVLSTPFFFSGLGTGTLLNAFPNSAGHTYAANLVGSALGCAVALIAPISLGAEGTVLLSCGLALAGGLVCSLLSSSTHENLQPEKLLSGSLLVAAFFLWGVGRYEGTGLLDGVNHLPLQRTFLCHAISRRRSGISSLECLFTHRSGAQRWGALSAGIELPLPKIPAARRWITPRCR